jgi:hypothetical protein
MTRESVRLLWLAPVLALFVAGGVSVGEEKGVAPKTVTALRYRIKIYDSELALLHDRGWWIDELWFPERGVVCNVVTETEVGTDGRLRRTHRMNAFFGPIRNEFRRHPNDPKPTVAPTEKVAVPAALAQKILDLAERTRQLGRAERRLGAQVADCGLLLTDRVERDD